MVCIQPAIKKLQGQCRNSCLFNYRFLLKRATKPPIIVAIDVGSGTDAGVQFDVPENQVESDESLPFASTANINLSPTSQDRFSKLKDCGLPVTTTPVQR